MSGGEGSGDPGPDVILSLPRDDHGPVFAEPWQAQAFAMAVRLHQQGHFEWSDWAAELARQIAAAGPLDSSDYYEHWLATLEVIVADRGLSSQRELSDRTQAWRRAAEATPHGQPIVLGAEE